MMDLEPGYAPEVDRVDKASWYDLLRAFDDANFYQTWSYGEKAWGEKGSSHFVLRRGGRVAAIAQLRIVDFPFLRTGAAYLNWGPLWKRRGEPADAADLRNIARALRNEYVDGRNYALRILPKIFDQSETDVAKEVFAKEGYRRSPDPLRTFVVDLRPSLEEMRQRLPRTWRQTLRFAEKQDLRIWEPSEPSHLELVTAINKQMKTRKSYIGSDSQELLSINADLPRELQLKILLCDHQGETIAALGWSNIGKVSFPLVGGTGDKALQYRASYLLWWEMIRLCQAGGFTHCDTAGVHQKRNPGGYLFKKGLAGRDAQETAYVGQFDAYRNYPTYFLFKTMMSIRGGLRNVARRLKSSLRKRPRRNPQ
jgi:hypothetical protein